MLAVRFLEIAAANTPLLKEFIMEVDLDHLNPDPDGLEPLYCLSFDEAHLLKVTLCLCRYNGVAPYGAKEFGKIEQLS